MCNWRRQVKFMPLDWGVVMRYQDYNSICCKRSKLPDRGNLSKRDYTSQRLWIFWNVMNIKKSCYLRFSRYYNLLSVVWFLYVSLSFKIFWTVCLITCQKKRMLCMFLVFSILSLKSDFLNFSLVAISQWWHSKQQLGNANHEECYFCGWAHQ